MMDNLELKKLLGQSKAEYAKYLECGDSDTLAEAGELLWECLKADVAQVTSVKTDNFNELMKAAAKMGENRNQLFYHCYHFHSWYLGGVPSDFEVEKKLYLKSVKSLENIIKNRESKKRGKKRELENATEAI
jgi:hypothetical protein